MSAITKACNITNSVKNTGKQCDSAMVATAMLIAMESGLVFDDNDLADPVSWLTTLIHQKKAFPLFGQKAPIREINNNKENDVEVTLDDGLQVFLRYGLYNRTFKTASGGLCYADALMSFLNSGLDIIEIDQQGQMLSRKNSDAVGGDYSPLITDYMKGMSPDLPDFKSTTYKNGFGYTFSPVELVQNGIIFKGASALLSMQGLIDAVLRKFAVTTQAGFTAATGTLTITAVGADGDVIVASTTNSNGTSVELGRYTKITGDNTVTLVAVALKNAINLLTGTHGFTANNVAGAITITAPSGYGTTINTVLPVATITGTMTASVVAFSGGLNGTTKLKIDIFTTCSDDNLVTRFGSALGTHVSNFSVQNVTSLGTEVAPASAAIVGTHVELTGVYISGRTYRVVGTSPETWLGNLVEGYDGSENYVDILVS